MNIGHFSRLPYDKDTQRDRTKESVGPGDYRLNIDHHYNKSACFHTEGPIGSHGSSTVAGDVVAPRLHMTDMEGVLQNRNFKLNGSKYGGENPVKATKQPLKHTNICNNYLAPHYSRITAPACSYRGLSINRFEDLPNNPQDHVFVDFAVNTTLEAKDNYVKQHKR